MIHRKTQNTNTVEENATRQNIHMIQTGQHYCNTAVHTGI